MNYDHHQSKYMIRQICINLKFHKNTPDQATLNLLLISLTKLAEITLTIAITFVINSPSIYQQFNQ